MKSVLQLLLEITVLLLSQWHLNPSGSSRLRSMLTMVESGMGICLLLFLSCATVRLQIRQSWANPRLSESRLCHTEKSNAEDMESKKYYGHTHFLASW